MRYFFVSLMVMVMIFCATSCWSRVERYGDVPHEKAPRTPISTLLLYPHQYVNKEVVIVGTISSECPTGGWINVEDEAGHAIHVEFHGAEFAPIPQRTGSEVVVKGVVFQSSSDSKEVQLLGNGVEIR